MSQVGGGSAEGVRRVVVATPDDPLVLRGGGRLEHVEVAFTAQGPLAPDRDNVVVVLHALTGDAVVTGEGGWWSSMVGPGRPVDTEHAHVVCANILGGCRGTTGPSSTDPATGRAHGLDFPALAAADLVAVHRRLLRHLGLPRVAALVGGSLGGVQALQWLLDHPDEVGTAVLVAATSRLGAESIGASAVGRHAILTDPDFHEGRYAERGVRPWRGLEVARMAAHLTYVAEAGLEAKFGRARRPAVRGGADADDHWPAFLGDVFEVESYLRHQGRAFTERFDALSYLYLTRLLDEFDPYGDPGAAGRLARLAAAGVPVLAVSFDSDRRFGTAHARALVQPLRRAGVPVEHHDLSSPWGHDSFLLAPPGYLDLVARHLAAHLPRFAPLPGHRYC